MANFLPNLSLLSIGTPSSKRPREDEEEEKTDFKKKLIDIDFSSYLLRTQKWSLVVSSEERTVTFDVHPEEERGDIVITVAGSEKPCVSMVLNSRELIVESLFFELNESQLQSCAIEPSVTQESSGYGAFVLNVVDVIAYKSGRTVLLSDSASSEKEGLKRFGKSLTSTLALLRGVSYYEARGFLPTFVVDELKAVYPEDQLKTAIAAQTVDLLWTHVTTTTPLDDVLAAIVGFHEQVKSVEDAPSYSAQMYSQEFCNLHTHEASVQIKKLFLLMQDRLLHEKYKKLSIRTLALDHLNGNALLLQTADGSTGKTLDGIITGYKEAVWVRNLPLPEEYRAEVEPDASNKIQWPPPTLTKRWFSTADPQEWVSLVCKPSSDQSQPATVQHQSWDIAAAKLYAEVEEEEVEELD